MHLFFYKGLIVRPRGSVGLSLLDSIISSASEERIAVVMVVVFGFWFLEEKNERKEG